MTSQFKILIGLLLCFALAAASFGKKSSKKSDEPDTAAGPTQEAPKPIAIPLPGQVEAIAVGGRGQFLFLELKKAQQIAVVDVTKGAMVKTIPLPSADFMVAAGEKKFFIGLKDLSQVQRWDIATMAHETNLNIPDHFEKLGMGAGSMGPLIAVGSSSSKRTFIIDPKSMRVMPLSWKHWGPGGAGGPVHMHVSFDGSTVVGCDGGWAGIEVAVLAGDQLLASEAGSYVNGDTLIAGDAGLIFPEGGSTLRNDLTSKVDVPKGKPMPADDPAYCMSLEESGGKPELHIFFSADTKTVLTLAGLSELAHKSELKPYERVQLIPAFKTLATVGENGRSLLLRHFDLVESLDALGIEYLFVDSAPPEWVLRGAAYKYPMHVQSKRGVVQFSLMSGPRNMKISPEGVIQWTAGENLLAQDAKVIVSISDASGKQIFNTWQIGMIDRAQKRMTTAPPETEHHQVIPTRTK